MRTTTKKVKAVPDPPAGEAGPDCPGCGGPTFHDEDDLGPRLVCPSCVCFGYVVVELADRDE